MDEVSPATLRGRVGEPFGFADATGRLVPFVLAEIDESADTLIAVFACVEGHSMPQGVYEVTHADLTPTAVLAVPESARSICVTFTWPPPSDASS